MGALADYVKKKFGVHTRANPNPATPTCGTTVTVLLRNNPDRLGYTIVNLGVTAMYVAWDRGVLASHGIYISPNGGLFGLTADEDGELVGWELFGIAITSANDIYVVEVEAA